MRYKVFREKSGKRQIPSFGGLEVLAHGIDLHWKLPDGTFNDVEFIVRPMAVQSTSASRLLHACNMVCKTLSTQGLRDRGQRLKLFILTGVPDNVASNKRKKVACALLLPGNCLYVGSLGCTAPRLRRIVASCTNEQTLVGDVHSVSLVFPVPRYRTTMQQRLREIVESELIILDWEDPAWGLHIDEIIKHTIGRQFHFVRGWLIGDEAP